MPTGCVLDATGLNGVYFTKNQAPWNQCAWEITKYFSQHCPGDQNDYTHITVRFWVRLLFNDNHPIVILDSYSTVYMFNGYVGYSWWEGSMIKSFTATGISYPPRVDCRHLGTAAYGASGGSGSPVIVNLTNATVDVL
jgi:hypothetical protein